VVAPRFSSWDKELWISDRRHRSQPRCHCAPGSSASIRLGRYQGPGSPRFTVHRVPSRDIGPLVHNGRAGGRALGASDRAFRATTLVIDGQQRLTSLFAVMRGIEIQGKDGEKRPITIAFRPQDGRFEVCDAAIRKNPEFLPNITELWRGPRTKAQIRKDMLKALEERGRIIDDAYRDAMDMNLDRAQGITNYRFPTVEIRKTATAEEIGEEDVAEIFVRINSQGTHLGQADFVLTLLSVFHGELRDRIDTGARSMSLNAIVPVDTQQILRTACAVGFQRARMSSIYKYLRGIDPVTGDPNPAGRIERLDQSSA
jgi:hypothetical protein